VSLLARHLECHGIITLIIGSGIDVVQHCAVPRYLHSDFPLGNPCGVPYDKEMQFEIMHQGLSLIETAKKPQTTERTPFCWKHDLWRDDYLRVDTSNIEELRQRGERRRQQQAADKAAEKLRAAMISDN
jgi:D-proline reductase (dithiol) PrdB